MISVVPLAGPDFVRPDGSVKALMEVEGQPLLRRALESRSWWRSGALREAGLVFVLRDLEVSRAFARDVLASWYPAAHTVFLSTLTGGAALSALAGVALVAQHHVPVSIDLVDILYEDAARPEELFAGRSRAGALALYFSADNPAYSYLELSSENRVIRSREKQVISPHASAGTYFFRSPSVYLRAAAHSLDHRERLAHRGLIFVCPALNGVVEEGWEVHAAAVTEVRDVTIAEKTPSLRRDRWTEPALRPALT
jgi:hypothetical protein